MRRFVAYLLLAAGCAWAQAPDPLDVRGVVIEPGTNLPIAGVQVTLYEFVEDQARFIVRKVYATTSSDARGAFQFHAERFGDYFLEAKKEGYSVPSIAGDTESAEASVTLRQDQPFPERRFSLMRPGELTGRLIDEDGNPILGLRVSAQNDPARPSLLQPSAVTDREGSFTIGKLAPDKYLLRIAPKAGDLEIVMPTFTEGDLKIVDQDFETSYLPMPVSPGASSNVGTITVRRASYYRAHISVVAEECGPREGWRFSALTTGSNLHFSGVSCAKEFLVRNLKPGSYWFTLSNGQDGGNNRQAFAPVEVRSENVDVELTMTPGGIVDGRMIAPEGGTLPPMSGVLIMAAPLITELGLVSRPVQPDSGKFSLQNLAATRYQISVLRLNPKYYVNEFRYNGTPVPDGFLAAGGNGQLEIVIDSPAATITGSVTDGDKPARQALIFLAKGPVTDIRQVIAGNTAIDQEGKFRITGLAPGEYRVLAIPDPSPDGSDNLIRLLGGAETVTLKRGSSQNISLKLTDITR